MEDKLTVNPVWAERLVAQVGEEEAVQRLSADASSFNVSDDERATSRARRTARREGLVPA